MDRHRWHTLTLKMSVAVATHSQDFPRLDASRNDAKDRMRPQLSRAQAAKPRAVANSEFPAKVLALILQLAQRDRNGHAPPSHRDLGRIEAVATRRAFFGHSPEISANARDRVSAGLESLELRVKPVALGFSQQHLLSQ